MKRLIFFLCVFFCVLGAHCSFAQHTNLRLQNVKVNGPAMSLDSLSVVPESIQLIVPQDSLFQITYDLTTGLFQLAGPGSFDSVKVAYRVFPFALQQKIQNRSLSLYDSAALFEDPVKLPRLDEAESLFPTEGVQKSGVLSRGIVFGNRQDVFVNSVLNLSLEGKLTEDLKIRGNITDQQVPYQPEGNTQQLQDFDRVLFEIYNGDFSLKAGDVILQNDSSHYMRFYKNVQGGQFSANYQTGENSQATTKAGAAVARGKFASVQLEVQEGIQGPYQLQVPQEGSWVLILANSEKVYLDGKLLTRGLDQDYVIDYNLGEVTFTEQNLLTQYSRVRVDFEYSDRNYSRRILIAGHEQQWGKLKVYGQFYQEKDNPNRPLTFELSQEQMLLLSELGNAKSGLISGADSVGYLEERILYAKADTLIAGKTYTLYRYSNDPDKAVYQLKFTKPENGKGNYQLRESTINGRIFDWVAPVNGEPQGTHEPMVEVPLPDQKQLFTAGLRWKLSAHESVYTEIGLSDHDQNLFSDLGEEYNQAGAFKLGYQTLHRPLSQKSEIYWKLKLDFEQTGAGFKGIDPFRVAEFNRNWNLTNEMLEEPMEDRMISANAAIEKNEANRIAYSGMYRDRGVQLNGWQHQLEAGKSLGLLHSSMSLFQNKSDLSESYSLWQKGHFDLHWKGKWLMPGYTFSLEEHGWRDGKDSLVASRQNYRQHHWYLRSGDSLSLSSELFYSIREDQTPSEGEWKEATYAQTTGFRLSRQMAQGQRLNATIMHRQVENHLEGENETSLVGRLNWTANYFQQHLRGQMTYQVSNSRELVREFVYLKVPGGQGTHTWRDENGDGIQDLGEFYEAVYQDERNYIKVFVPTNEFVPAFSNTFNGNLNLDFPRNWRKESGWKSMISRFAVQASWSSVKKTTDSRTISKLLPWGESAQSEQLLGLRQQWRGRLFYNRAQPLSFDLSLLETLHKQLLTQGYEWKKRQTIQLNTRWTQSRALMWKWLVGHGRLFSESDYLQDRIFTVQHWEAAPQVSWRMNNRLRWNLAHRFIYKHTIYAPANPAHMNRNETDLGIYFIKAATTNLNANLRYIHIDFEGAEQTALGYELLQGLRPGHNLTWTLAVQQKLLNGLQMNLIYDGRKSPEMKPVHTGRVQVSALF